MAKIIEIKRQFENEVGSDLPPTVQQEETADNENINLTAALNYLEGFFPAAVIKSILFEDIYEGIKKKHFSQAVIDKLKSFGLNAQMLFSLPEEVVNMIGEYFRLENNIKIKFLENMTEDDKHEFIFGEVIMQSPATWGQLTCLMNLGCIIGPFVKKNKLGKAFASMLVCSFGRNTFMPDFTFWRKEISDNFTGDQEVFPPPNFIVEVLSKSTEERDRGIKKDYYEKYSVAEYWIIDAEAKTIEQYILQDEKYTMIYFVKYLKDTEQFIKCRVIKNLILPIKDIFDES